MKLNKNAIEVLNRRYLVRNEKNDVCETPEDLFRRVAGTIAESDRLYDNTADISAVSGEFYEMMTNLEFLPNSPTLMNAGRPLGQLSACFVLPVEDSMEAIFEAIKQAALIHKSGGGTGFSFSSLRPKGASVNSTGGVASGPVSFMRVFNMATEAVKQGGTRRGANMGILRVDHPDILEFIDCKRNNADITNFNISVGITEEFMNAVADGRDYDLRSPGDNIVTGTLNAGEVFEKIVTAAWQNGEPGIIFLDRLDRDNPVPSQGRIEATNPCGEQPLLPYESCNLGSINLTAMVKDADGKPVLDREKLTETVHKAVHFLDNVIDANRYPLKMIDETTKLTRKIGLGVMGFADLLLMTGISYNSDKGVALADEIMSLISKEGRAASAALAEKRGNFPAYAESVWAGKGPMRNAAVTTIAPTGTLSILADCSSGVEPVFAFAFFRNVMDGTKLAEVNGYLKDELTARGIYSPELMEKIAEAGSIQHIEEIPEDVRRIFVCAHDISPEYHIRMQAAFQEHTDNAVSKTVNFCSDATKEDVRDVYLKAFTSGCKGVTIYRDGSRSEQVLNIGSGREAAPATPDSIVPRPRPDTTVGVTERVKIGCGNLYITVNYDDDGICEVFTNTGRAGGCPSQSEATARLVSVSLRSGISADAIIEQLKGIRCPSTIRQSGMKCTSCPDAIAKAVERVARRRQEGVPGAVPVRESRQAFPPETTAGKMRFCPECGEKVEHEGGCVMCRSCGYSKCN